MASKESNPASAEKISGGEEWGGPPLLDTARIESLIDDDAALQRRALLHLVALMEAPIMQERPRLPGREISPGLARLRADIAMHIRGLLVEPAGGAGHADRPAAPEGARGEANGSHGIRRLG